MTNANFSVIVTCLCYCDLLLNGYCGLCSLLAHMLALLAHVFACQIACQLLAHVFLNSYRPIQE